MKSLLLMLKTILEEKKLNIEKNKLEEQELSGNIVKNKVSKIQLSESCDLSRIRYDYGIRLQNDNIVKVKSDQLVLDEYGMLYFLDEKQNEELEIGNIEEYLYEFDIYKQEWRKADVENILVNADFSIKDSKLKEVDKKIMENRNLDFYSNIYRKNFEVRGVGVYEKQ